LPPWVPCLRFSRSGGRLCPLDLVGLPAAGLLVRFACTAVLVLLPECRCVLPGGLLLPRAVGARPGTLLKRTRSEPSRVRVREWAVGSRTNTQTFSAPAAGFSALAAAKNHSEPVPLVSSPQTLRCKRCRRA